jgi:hypothetical protein
VLKGKYLKIISIKKAVVEIIPVLKYEGGEYSLKPIVLTGRVCKR